MAFAHRRSARLFLVIAALNNNQVVRSAFTVTWLVHIGMLHQPHVR